VVDVFDYSEDFDRVYVVLHYLGEGNFRNTAGLSLENRLQSVMRCRAVCSTFSGQLHSGVGSCNLIMVIIIIIIIIHQ